MFVPELIRDAFIGQLVYYASGRRVFNYVEDRPGFVVPARFIPDDADDPTLPSSDSQSTATLPPPPDREQDAGRTKKRESMPPVTVEVEETIPDRPKDVEKAELAEREPQEQQPPSPHLVTWYGSADPEDPRNVRTHY